MRVAPRRPVSGDVLATGADGLPLDALSAACDRSLLERPRRVVTRKTHLDVAVLGREPAGVDERHGNARLSDAGAHCITMPQRYTYGLLNAAATRIFSGA